MSISNSVSSPGSPGSPIKPPKPNAPTSHASPRPASSPPPVSSPLARSLEGASHPTAQDFTSLQRGKVVGTPLLSRGAEKMGYWQIMKELYRTVIQDPQSRKAALGYALKLLPDMIMSGLFAIPVVGWFAGITGSFWGGKLENKGEKILKELESNLDPNNRLHSSLKHFRKGEIAWNAEKNQQYFGKPKPGKPPFHLAEYLAHKYNKVLDGWLAHIAPVLNKERQMESVFRRLSLDWQGQTEKGPSKVFRTFKRWIEARQSLRQTKVLGPVFNWMSGLNTRNMERVLPRVLQRLMLLPRLSLQLLFFVLGKKPRF